MRTVQKLATTLSLLLALPVAPAVAGDLDGAWECRSIGPLIATIGIADDNYVIANAEGPSGRGILSIEQGSFAVESGPLLDDLDMQGGWLSLDKGEPMLTVVSESSGRMFCYAK